ncbi:carbohydrate kinase family protein [Pararhodonellum marinum]|uniref:carbohydrate kinase family protein n=1 Tax=Pararhodonellum marinum TaxID=2755358 RepID=UPI00188DD272|nr:carbohydrate kinase family protein [Pararhodonellum marinum]
MENSERHGLIAGGNWIMDQIKIIDQYPHQDGLANIVDQSLGNGGSPYNILKNLSKLEAGFPLYGVGLIGDDIHGQAILKDCLQHGIDTTDLKITQEAPTAFSDVMSVKKTGRRTFFHFRGANAYLTDEDFPLKQSTAKILHLGYLLLLDKLDISDAQGRTKASHLFEKAQSLGFKTSLDIVSESSERFTQVVPSTLPYTNYLFLNEFEAGKIVEMDLDVAASLSSSTVNLDLCRFKEASDRLFAMGVLEWVFIHCPHGVMAFHANGDHYLQGSLMLPDNLIVSTSGAGDAFTAGVLLFLHDQKPIQECLKMGIYTAAASLLKPGCSEGVLPKDQTIAWAKQWAFREIKETAKLTDF